MVDDLDVVVVADIVLLGCGQSFGEEGDGKFERERKLGCFIAFMIVSGLNAPDDLCDLLSPI